MKKTQRKDALRNIWKRVASYLSVVLVITLGTIGLLVTFFVKAGMEEKGDHYYRKQAFKDFDLICSAGISEANLDRIRGVDGVETVEGVLQGDGSAAFGGKKRSVTVITMTEHLSIPKLMEGKNPEKKDECMVGEDFAEIDGLKVGDRIRLTFAAVDELGDEEPLYCEEFTITGLMAHPDYLRRKSTNTVVLPACAFNEKATRGYYTHAFVGLAQPEDCNILSDQYLESVADTRKDLEDMTEVLAAERTKEIRDEANKAIDEQEDAAEKKFDKAKKKLDDAQDKLDRKVAEANQQIQAGQKQIDDSRSYINYMKSLLPQVKKALKKAKQAFKAGTKWISGALSTANKLLAKMKKPGAQDDPQYQAMEQQLASTLIANQSSMQAAVSFAKSDTAATAAKKAQGLGVNIKPVIDKVAGLPVDSIIAASNKVINGGHYSRSMLNSIVNTLNAILSVRTQFGTIEQTIAAGETKLINATNLLQQKVEELEAGKLKLERERSSAQTKIDDGRSKYTTQRKKYKKKIKEAREEVLRMDCAWIVLDRAANNGYVDIRSNISAIQSAGMAFGGLFIIITALVCFSTLVIIIDEQKKLVGTVKAFGFHKGEVFGKYLVFGISAALAGSVLGIIFSVIVGHFVQQSLADSRMYPFGAARTIVLPGVVAVTTVIMIAVTTLATVIACTGILKTPASVLMKGGSLKKSSYSGKKEKKSARRKGSLYSRLILRNMRDDKARVAVTVAVIGFCCMLIGTSICMKRSFDAMIEKQSSEIYLYDLRVDLGSKTGEKEQQALSEVMEKHGVSFLPAAYENFLYRWNGRLDGLQMICADPEHLGEYIAVNDRSTGGAAEIPDDGILIQHRMNESYGMKAGDTLPLLDSSLEPKEAVIRGTFTNYIGRMAVTSPAGYRQIFGGDPQTNCYYVNLNGAGEEELKKDLLAVSGDISFESSGDSAKKYEAVRDLYNILVAIMMGTSILISFMILTNLAHIFLTRKKTELTVMRVNGFSVRQTKGYLTRETVMTTAAGLVLGLIAGILVAPKVIGMIQQPDLEFVKTFHPVPWLIALGVEAFFALVINAFVFRKVKDLDLKDIA